MEAGTKSKRPQPIVQERGDDAGLVSDAADDPAGRQRHDEVGAEETELHQQRENVGEMEEILEVRNQDVVERGDEADAEVEGHHQDHRQDVASRCFIANRMCLHLRWFQLPCVSPVACPLRNLMIECLMRIRHPASSWLSVLEARTLCLM